jgi:hypothetical protein
LIAFGRMIKLIMFSLFVLQAHFSRAELPISDYITDLKSVLDQSIRIIQAMIDICANSGWLESALTCMHLLQMIIQVNFVVQLLLKFILVLYWRIVLYYYQNPKHIFFDLHFDFVRVSGLRGIHHFGCYHP